MTNHAPERPPLPVSLRRSPRRFYPDVVERDRLFIATIDWLEQVAQRSENELDVLFASGRLRLLLLDSYPLVDQVNPREGRVPIRFHIIRNSLAPPLPVKAEIHMYPDGLDPSILNPGAGAWDYVEYVDRKTFLREPVLEYRGVTATVRDLIHHTANVAGGVHAGRARSAKDEALSGLAEEIALGGMAAGTRCLRGLVRITVEAMRPLRDMLANRPTSPPLT